jgi:glycine betaine catabolism B
VLKTKIINTLTNDVYSAALKPRSAQQAECLIGRHPNCDLVLDGPAVSRIHGRVLFEAEQCFFIDLGSTDGSRLNNEEIYVNQAYAIAPDDVIRIGEFAVIIEAIDLSEKSLAASRSSLWSKEEITVRCVQIIQETQAVKTFRFVAEPELLFDFKPGQFVTLKLPIESAQRPVIRSYSISSSPTRPHTLDITVKRVGAASRELPPGQASHWLHNQLKVGTKLQIQGPFGAFNCIDHPADRLLLISAGSGITPMMSMAQWLSDRATCTDITFIHAARCPQEIIFRQRLALLAAQHPHFKLAFTLTQPPKEPWAGYRGRLNAALLSAMCPDSAERTAFVCGPAGFISSTQALLKAAGLPMENYFEESFGKSPAPPQNRPSVPQKSQPAAKTAKEGDTAVEFSASAKTIACDPADTLLEVAEQAGIAMVSGCRMGSCGACKQQLIAGEVRYEQAPRGLSQGDRAAGQVLACVAKPIGRVVLAL